MGTPRPTKNLPPLSSYLGKLIFDFFTHIRSTSPIHLRTNTNSLFAMTQFSNQTDPSTDAYSTTSSTAASKIGISANQKKLLGISAATVLLGGAVGLVLARPKDGESPEPEPDENSSSVTGNQLTGTIPTDIDVAGKVTDSMSFEQAFGAARDEVGMGGVFSWHGHWYNTFEKDEWTGLSIEQRQDYTEMVTGEKLPVKPYAPKPTTEYIPTPVEAQTEPTIIEGYLNGQRVMGLDYDQDGVIDTLVMDGSDGQTYRVVDATGDQGLDTIYRYDSLDGRLTGAVVLDHPVVLSNEDFSQGLEASMSKEVVDSILESDEPTTPTVPTDQLSDEQDETGYLADSSEPDDTYINNGNVRDMDD